MKKMTSSVLTLRSEMLASLLVLASSLSLVSCCCPFVQGVQYKSKAQTTTTWSNPATSGSIHVISKNGDISVVEDSSVKSLTITATLDARGETQELADQRLQQMSVNVTSEGDVITLEAVFAPTRRSGEGVSMEIVIPDLSGVDINSSNGNVVIAGADGTTSVDTSNGNISLRKSTGSASLETSNSRVDVMGHKGAVDIETSNGKVLVEDHDGRPHARTHAIARHHTSIVLP